MSAMRQSRPAKKTTFDQAFSTYVRLVKPIQEVVAVLADNGSEFSVTTIIKRRNLRVCARLFEIEEEFLGRLSNLEPDFHILYAQGRPLEQMIAKLSSMRSKP